MSTARARSLKEDVKIIPSYWTDQLDKSFSKECPSCNNVFRDRWRFIVPKFYEISQDPSITNCWEIGHGTWKECDFCDIWTCARCYKIQSKYQRCESLGFVCKFCIFVHPSDYLKSRYHSGKCKKCQSVC